MLRRCLRHIIDGSLQVRVNLIKVTCAQLFVRRNKVLGGRCFRHWDRSMDLALGDTFNRMRPCTDGVNKAYLNHLFPWRFIFFRILPEGDANLKKSSCKISFQVFLSIGAFGPEIPGNSAGNRETKKPQSTWKITGHFTGPKFSVPKISPNKVPKCRLPQHGGLEWPVSPAECSQQSVPVKGSLPRKAFYPPTKHVLGAIPLRKQILQLVGIKVRYSPSQLIKFQPVKQPTNPSINQPTNQSNHFLIAVLSFFWVRKISLSFCQRWKKIWSLSVWHQRVCNLRRGSWFVMDTFSWIGLLLG